MAIDMNQYIYMQAKIDGVKDEIRAEGPFQDCLRKLLIAMREPEVRWRNKTSSKHIRVDFSDMPIKAASDMTRVDEIAAGMEFDLTEDEYLAQLEAEQSGDSTVQTESNLASDPQMVRLININYSKAAFESALPDEIQSLLTYARLNYPIWFTHTFVKKHIP